jgi:hypothetical protein
MLKNKSLPDCLAHSYLTAATPAQPFFRRHYSIMVKDIIKQVEPHIREILRLRGVFDAEGRELHKLNELVGRTSEFVEDVEHYPKDIC